MRCVVNRPTIIVLSLFLTMASLTHAETPPRTTTQPSAKDAELIRRFQCSQNITALAQSIEVYANDNGGKYPPDLGTLLTAYNLDLPRFICPGAPNALPANWQKLPPKEQAAWVNAHTDYIFLRPGQMDDMDGNKPMVYEKDDDHHGGGMWVAFSDAHIEFIPLAEVHRRFGPQAGAEHATTRVKPTPGQPPSIPLISTDELKASFARADISKLNAALNMFETDVGRYPTTQEGLKVLIEKPAANANGWHGPYLPKPLLDPWEHSYLYTFDGKETHVTSSGPDGKPNTADDIKPQQSH